MIGNVFIDRIKYEVNRILELFGLKVIRSDSLDQLTALRRHPSSYFVLSELMNTSKNNEQLQLLVELATRSPAQLFQDLVILKELDFKTEGFFVEFGASNGISNSNTWLLEKQFGWDGILVEPAHVWRSKLTRNRSAEVDTRCVWSSSKKLLEFNETKNPELSTTQSFLQSDFHNRNGQISKKYTVETVSLNDLLYDYDAPDVIDYLSMDTEGSEWEIIKTLDFNTRLIRIISCEHNFGPNRTKVQAFLAGKGYTRIYESLSSFDDWFVFRN